MKKGLTKRFFDEICRKSPEKNYETNGIIYNHFDEIWSIDLAHFSDYKISNNKGFRYLFVIIENFSKYTWCIPFKTK